MDESAFSDINAHMAKGASHGVEKDQITRFEFFSLNDFGAAGLLFCTSWQELADRFFINVANKTAAVEAGVCGARRLCSQ